jgi:hypothetical protein
MWVPSLWELNVASLPDFAVYHIARLASVRFERG